jgi:hypothetical protein
MPPLNVLTRLPRRQLAVCGFYLIVAVLITFPLVTVLSSRLIGDSYFGEMSGAILIFMGFWLATNAPEGAPARPSHLPDRRAAERVRLGGRRFLRRRLRAGEGVIIATWLGRRRSAFS